MSETNCACASELAVARDDVAKLEEALLAAVETARSEATQAAILRDEAAKLRATIAGLTQRLGDVLGMIDQKSYQTAEDQAKIRNAQGVYNLLRTP